MSAVVIPFPPQRHTTHPGGSRPLRCATTHRVVDACLAALAAGEAWPRPNRTQRAIVAALAELRADVEPVR